MIRKAIWLAATAVLLTLPTAGAQAQERVVNVYNWSDYIDQSIIADFTKETGIKVVYDVYDSNEILETKLLAGGSGYDVVVPTATPFLVRQIAAGVYQKLDKSKLPNLKNMWDVVQERVAAFDPGNEYSVNYMWGTTGIGYNTKKIKEALGVDAIDSWDTVFKPENLAKLKDCGVMMLDSPTDILPTALNYLKIDPNSNSAEDLAKAEELMLSIRPSVRKFHSSEYINALANGDICLAVGFSGDLFQARNRAEEAKAGVEIAYTIPKEGAEMWFDQMAIPADAKHVPEALEFINYMMKPEVIAKSTDYVYYANGNKASQPLINKEITGDPTIYPDEETMKKLFTVKPYDPKTQRTITRIWTKVVTGQ
ncbi:polyamine ABC transporter substrate-binding protein [Mesorhizobium retamae]|uniref:Putrescine-binding periplasmic protein n=1 Tax=Mesorhizobium retamae TaxID=2912854 RepID=A0ABS9QH44_9HYPH|nr:polyamine ABC transporter substrate-binding protein [Mesorhizobium sp. IRAMC:0171]MCG7506762.1 polyamine ABC transporter substrate-binding protein [Mesorhizobium sp. IRAMC:0171]